MDIINQIIETQHQILEKLIECEATVAELYALYADCMPDQSAFWRTIAAEERYHTNLLIQVRAQLDRGELFRNLGKFNAESTQKLIDYVSLRMEEAKKSPPDHAYGVAVALEIESSIIDSRFFDIATSDAAEFKGIAAQISSDTRDHVKRVQDEKLRCDKLRRAAKLPRPPVPPSL